jgi:hypothetical protein
MQLVKNMKYFLRAFFDLLIQSQMIPDLDRIPRLLITNLTINHKHYKLVISYQCFGSGLDPDSIRLVDPDSQSGSGSWRAKMTHKNRKKLINFMF